MLWRRLALIDLSSAAAGLLIWLTASQRLSWPGRDRQASGLNQQRVDPLLIQTSGQGSGEAETTRLRQLLVLGYLEEAQLLLNRLTARSPRTIQQRLLSVDLRRLNGDTAGARKELQQLLSLHPDHPQALALGVLMDLQEGKGNKTLQHLEQRFRGASRGGRTDFGLLIADLQRQSGKAGAAASLYLQLSLESPTDPRPLIALAMLRRDQGKSEEMLGLLEKARKRRPEDGPLIDDLAASWGVSAARIRGLQQERTRRVPSEKL